jgi:hypothetical protein
VEIAFVPVESLVAYERNPNTHKPAQIEQIAASIEEWGWTFPILADANGVVAGHGRKAAAELLYQRGAKLRMSSGQEIPAGMVPRIDCSGWSEDQRRAYIIADNKLASNATWDDKLLTFELGELKAEGFDLGLVGFGDSELSHIFSQDQSRYSRKMVTPVYETTGEKPTVAELTDHTRARELLAEIDAAELPDDVRAFLRSAAARHVVFNYHAIAEFYSHASEDVQRLMENSALVIIDFERAIELGYVKMTTQLNEIYGRSYDDTTKSSVKKTA